MRTAPNLTQATIQAAAAAAAAAASLVSKREQKRQRSKQAKIPPKPQISCQRCNRTLKSPQEAMKHIQYHLHHTASREPLPQHLQQLATHFDLTQCPICAWYFTTTKQRISRKHNPSIPFGKGSTGKEEVDDDQPATTTKQLTYHSPSHSTHAIQHPQPHFPPFGLTNTPIKPPTKAPATSPYTSDDT